MRLHVHKRGFRALGISESYIKGAGKKSILAGIVMRADLIVDGLVFSRATIGGTDATERLVEMYLSLGRNDINIILLNGCVISWYNVVDIGRVADETSRPIICVTYEESEGLEKYFKDLFPKDWKNRVEIYHKNGARTLMKISTGHSVYVRPVGVDVDETRVLLNKFTTHGAVPEPLRVARIAASAAFKSLGVIA